jgi:hypothetical protein
VAFFLPKARNFNPHFIALERIYPEGIGSKYTGYLQHGIVSKTGGILESLRCKKGNSQICQVLDQSRGGGMGCNYRG